MMPAGVSQMGGSLRPREYRVSHIPCVYLEVHEDLLPLGPSSLFYVQ